MQQAYGTTNAAAAASYMNTASSFYNSSSYPYSSIGPSRTLNSAMKTSSSYLASPYSSPTSPFQAPAHSQTAQYASYSNYGTPGSSSFTQGFGAQVMVLRSVLRFDVNFRYKFACNEIFTCSSHWLQCFVLTQSL